MDKIILYHGGDKPMPTAHIQRPGPRADCDFGQGFYLTPDKHIAEEWVRKKQPPIISVYELTYSPQEVLHLAGDDWLRVIIGCRENAYPVRFSKNIVIGSIANDRLFPMLGLFMDTTLIVGIGDRRLLECITLVNLGDQYVLKDSTHGLVLLESYALTGERLHAANDRHATRRRGMNDALAAIRRKNYDNERFADDFIKECRDGITL